MVRWSHVAVAGALLTGLAAGRAQAYVRSTDRACRFFWKESCVPVTIYLNHFDTTSGMRVEQIVKSVAAAAHAWSADTVTCQDGGSPYLEIVPTLAPASAAPPTVAWDARNSIIFRTDMWSKSGSPDPTAAFAFEALAVTTVTARLDGHIVDVDMEVNGVNKTWMNLDPGVSLPFDRGDRCWRSSICRTRSRTSSGTSSAWITRASSPAPTGPTVDTDGKPRPTDNLGNLIPDCDAAPVSVANTVMFNVTVPGETSKRFLSDDDKLAVCTIYAPSKEHDACALDSANPGCAVGPPSPAPRARRAWALGLSAGVLAVVSILATRRRA